MEISFDEKLEEKEILSKVEDYCWDMEEETNIIEITVDNVIGSSID